MELRQFEYFIAVEEERHFTRAAQRVHVVQSSLSSAIRALERELGTELLIRNSRRVELTDAGRAFLPAARRALAAARAGRDAVDAVRGLLSGALNIGFIQSLGIIDLPDLLTRYHAQYPGVSLRLHNDSVGALVQATVDGDFDLAFVDRPLDESRVRVVELGIESLVLVARADDPVARRRKVPLTSLTSREFVDFRSDSALRARIDESYAGLGIARRIACEVGTITELADLVAHGMGLALLPPLSARGTEGLVRLAIEPVIQRELAVVTAADRPPSAAASALLDLVEQSLTSSRRRS